MNKIILSCWLVKMSNDETNNKPGQISEYIGLPQYPSPSTHCKFRRFRVRVDQCQLELCRFPKRRFIKQEVEVENILQLTYQLMSQLGKKQDFHHNHCWTGAG